MDTIQAQQPNNKKTILIISVIGVLLIVGIVMFMLMKNNNSNEITVKNSREFSAALYLYTKEEGGRSTPIFNNFKSYLRPVDNNEGKIIRYECTIKFEDNIERIDNGTSANVKVVLTEPILLKKGYQFYLDEGGRKIARVIVSEVK